MIFTQQQIGLHGLRFYAYHGVMPQERKVGAAYTVDLLLDVDMAHEALMDDQLDGTVSYAEVYDVVAQAMAVSSALLEHATTRILQALFAQFPRIQRITATLRKDTPPIGGATEGCSVTLSAKREAERS